MKKTVLLFFVCIAIHYTSVSQSLLLTQAPLGPTTTQVRAPNGTSSHAFLRACSLVLPSELSTLPSGSTLSTFGFTLSTGTSPLAVAGTFTVYLQNTPDVTYQKTTSWATIMTGMTTVYASTMTIPASAGTTSVTVTLSTPFVYTGGGLYVAYDWNATSTTNPQGTTNFATYYAEGTALAIGGCSSAANITAPATTLGTTAYRPSFLFGITNPYANDIQIMGIVAPGKIAGTLNAPHNITAVVKNSGYDLQTNITVSLNVTGANPFTNAQTITSLAAGASTVVTFTAYNPLTAGSNSITVSVPADDNTANNSGFYPQLVSCDVWAQNPATGANTYTNGALGFGTATGILATPFLNVTTSTLTGLSAAISNDVNAIGNSVYGVALSAAGVVLATTNTLVITNTMQATFQNVSFTTPLSLTAGTTYYLGFAQTANATAYYPAGTLSSAYVKPNTYFGTSITGGVYTPIATSFGYFGIEGIFAPSPITTSGSNTVCIGQPLNLTASGASSYLWSNSTSTVSATSTLSVIPQVNTTYTVVGTNSSGCNGKAVVTAFVILLPSVSINVASQVVCQGSNMTFTASGANTYTWTGNGITGANANAASLTLNQTALGTFSNVVTGTGQNGCNNTAAYTYTVDACLGLKDHVNATDISVFPNPTHGKLTLVSEHTGTASSVEIYNAMGALVKTQSLLLSETIIDLSDLADGVYTLQVKQDQQPVYTSKIIKH